MSFVHISFQEGFKELRLVVVAHVAGHLHMLLIQTFLHPSDWVEQSQSCWQSYVQDDRKLCHFTAQVKCHQDKP